MIQVAGKLFGSGYWFDQRYKSIWCDMIRQSINHSKHRQFSSDTFRTKKYWKLQEVFLSRCYILSELFAQDCYLIGWDDWQITKARESCTKHWHKLKKRCVVCGKTASEKSLSGDSLCWDHNRVIQEFGKGRDPNYEHIKKDEPIQREFELLVADRERRKQVSLSDTDRETIINRYTEGDKSYGSGITDRLAKDYGITPQYVRQLVRR